MFAPEDNGSAICLQLDRGNFWLKRRNEYRALQLIRILRPIPTRARVSLYLSLSSPLHSWQKYDWNILCLLNSRWVFLNTKWPAQDSELHVCMFILLK